MTTRPNVVFVLTDDQGYGDLGCTGNPWVKTPCIDQFYQESVRLTNFHVGPTCAPTRAGLMSGHYANSTGVWHTIGGRSLLRDGEWTLAQALSEHGYKTGIFGKWHLGDSHPYRPEDRGFQKSVIHGGGGISQTPDYWGNDYFDDTYFVDGQPQKFQGYCTDMFFHEALNFINENKDTPFFCYIATNAPHGPYNVPDDYADQYRGKVMENRARFYGMITNIDDNFANLRQKLKDLSIEKDTILIFMTDNGSSMALSYDENGAVVEGYNAGLRGLKDSPYDGGHRTPFFIQWKNGGIDGGRDIDDLTANVDFMPTILDLCSIQTDRSFHGISLKNALLNKATIPDRTIVTDSQRVAQPIKWRKSCAMTKKWRLINGIELYDIESDRCQENDVSSQFPDIVEKLREGYEKWWNLVSVDFDKIVPFHLNKENYLTAHDWRGDESNCVWNQGQVRQGQESKGYWEIAVDIPGRYRIRLYRWSIETGYRLSQGIDGNDSGFCREYIHPDSWNRFEGGRAIPICKALLRIDQDVYTQKTDPEDTFAEFIVDLSVGEYQLEGIFKTKISQFGAYYAKIDKLENEES